MILVSSMMLMTPWRLLRSFKEVVLQVIMYDIDHLEQMTHLL